MASGGIPPSGGVSIATMTGGNSPWHAPEFPLVTPGHDHVVLYQIGHKGPTGHPPRPTDGQDKWDQHHVKMPCSESSTILSNNPIIPNKKRWKVIKKAFKNPITNSYELAQAILKYNAQYNGAWKFAALHKLFNQDLDKNKSEEFFKNTLPKIINLALELDKVIRAPIPLLKQNKSMSISMSQKQIASILANAFLCTYPFRNTYEYGQEYSNYSKINLISLFERLDLENGLEKLKCFLNYFKRVTDKIPTGVVTYTRRAVDSRQYPRWEHSSELVTSVPLYADDRLCIEDANGLLQVDFANKFIGGGVLGRGCVQEEIRFLICPELVASMLFTEKLGPNEALVIIGCERFSRYKGYGRKFHFAGDYNDKTPTDGSNRRRCAVLAIDAVPYRDPSLQFRKSMITKELNKAWVGFSYDSDPSSPKLRYPGVATGNWGCGAFGGSPQLKSLLQLMACAQARRPMAYLSFGDTTVKNEVIAMYTLLKHHKVTIGQLYQMLMKYKSNVNMHLHDYIQQKLSKPDYGQNSRSSFVQNDSSNDDTDDGDDNDTSSPNVPYANKPNSHPKQQSPRGQPRKQFNANRNVYNANNQSNQGNSVNQTPYNSSLGTYPTQQPMNSGFGTNQQTHNTQGQVYGPNTQGQSYGSNTQGQVYGPNTQGQAYGSNTQGQAYGL